jgi:hypothetical protein
MSMKTLLRIFTGGAPLAAILLTLFTSQNTARAATRTWIGVGADPFWGNTNNWSGSVRPAATDDVVFATSTPQMATVNNWIGALRSITFGVGGYSISGNALVLTNGINATNAAGQNAIAPPITLGANQFFTNVNAHASLLLVVLDLNGHAVTFRGAGSNLISGSISDGAGGASLTNAGTGVFQLSGTNNSFTGPTVLTAGTNLINSFHRRSPITWTEGTLGGTGQLGQVTASGFSAKGKTLMPGFGGTGILTTSNLVLNSQCTNIARINGFIPGVDYDQIVVSNGNVTLGDVTFGFPHLNVSLLPTLTGSFGDTITLINVLNPTNTVSGKFRNWDEGDVIMNDAYFYKFSYAGGDGNDVTLSVVGRTSTGNTRIWAGGGTNNLWSNTNNWSLAVAPVLGDAVTFPHNASRRTNVNDFPAEFTFDSLSFTAPSGATLNYSLSGNALRLNDGVRLLPTTFASDVAGAVVISNDLILNLGQTFTNGIDADLHLAGKLNTDFHTLNAYPRAGAEIFFDGPITDSGGLNVGYGVVHLGGSNSIGQINIVFSGMVIATHAQALESADAFAPLLVQSGTLRLQASNAVFTGPVISIRSRLELVPAPNAALAAPLSIVSSNTIVILTNLFGVATNFTLQAGVTNSTLLTNAAGGGTLHIGPTASVVGGGILRNLGALDVDGIVHNVVLLGSNLRNGTLSGAGQIDTVISTNLGTIAPGSATDVTKALDPLTVGRLELGNNNGSIVEMELFPNRPGGGATNDQIIASNAPTLGSATLKVTALASLAPNERFTILRNLSAAPVTNTFNGLPEGAFLAATNGNLALRISYIGGAGHDIVLTVQSNTPPTIAATNNLTVNELATLTYTNVASDIEQPPQSFTWTLLTPISGMTLNSTNGVLTWTPTEAQGRSTNTVLVKATDSGSPPMSSTGTVIITVQELNVAPVPVAVPDTNVIAGNTLMIQLAANDSDIPANPLTWQPINLPIGASLTTNGLFTYTPGALEFGRKTNTVRVFDFNADAVNSKSFTNNLTFFVNVTQHRIVTNTNDSGAGSLRQAIAETFSNRLDAAYIEFNIPGSGVQKIVPLTALPTTALNTTIDGYTQPGSHPNTKTNGTDAVILIEISGEGQNPVNGSDGLSWSEGTKIIRGLCINRFTNGTAINSSCSGCGGQVIEGCFIGTDPSGTIARPNGHGVNFLRTSNSRIGGPDVSQRNLISGNLAEAISASQGFGDRDTFNLTIQNNLIGTDRTGTNALGNGTYGIITPTGGVGGQGFDGSGCLVADNVIAASGYMGVDFGGTGNVFVRNKIGVGVNGVTALGNGTAAFGNGGLFLFGTGHRVGGTNIADANVIAYNDGPGVQISSGDFDTGATNHTILGNSIFANVGLAIDLGSFGSITNDPGDVDAGPNNLQNFPVLSAATPGPGSVTISGTLNSVSNKAYRLEFFHTPVEFAVGNQQQAKTFLGATNVTTDSSGNASFSVTFNKTISGGFITATATDPAGNTSEISTGLGFAFARLNIARNGAQVRVLWPTNLTTFNLQSNADVALPAGWMNVPGTPGLTGSNFFRDFTPNGSTFFRLRSP